MRLAVLAVLLASAPADALPPPPVVAEATVVEHLGTQLPLDLGFTDVAGHDVRLRDELRGDKPLLLVLAYYECPMLCSLVLDGTVNAIQALEGMGWRVGDQYRVLTISFSDRELPYQAGKKQGALLGKLPHVRAADWPFWVGHEPEIRALTDALGFRFARDPATGQLAHPAAIFVLTPEGKISRYFYGIEFPARDLRFALLEAGDGKVGTLGERILLTCFRYDPASRRYGFFVQRFMQGGALIIFFIVAGVLAVLWRRERRRA
jgi:protein SCO1/2